MAVDQRRRAFQPIETSHWNASAITLPPYSRLDGGITADVAVIGGGYTGLSAALHAAEAGLSVALIEAEQPGWAASGRNAAQVCPLLAGTDADKVVAQLGRDQGERLLRMIATSGQSVYDLIGRLGIDCNPRRTGGVFVCRSEKGLSAFISAVDKLVPYGARIEHLDKDALKRHVTSDRYAGGVRYLDGGLIQPLSFARGLALAADRAGVSIYGQSAALAVEPAASGWHVRTAHGVISASKVIFATGSYLEGDLAPALQTVGYTVLAAGIASKPLPDGGKSILPGGGPIADLDDKAVFSPAIDSEGRLVMTVMVEGNDRSIDDLIPIADRRLRKAFPQLEPVEWESHWFGNMMVTPDHLPRIIRVGPDCYAGVGCQGLGITYGVITGMELARLAVGSPESAISIPVSAPAAVPMVNLIPRVLAHVLVPLVNRFTA